MKWLAGIFIALLAGCLALLGVGASQPSVLCEIDRANTVTELPTLATYTAAQRDVATAIVDGFPSTRVEAMAIAVATSLAATNLATAQTIDGDQVHVNTFTGTPSDLTLEDQVDQFEARLAADPTWTTRPASDVVAWALGRPGADVKGDYQQASLLVAEIATTDAEYLLEQQVKDPNCLYSSTVIGDILTIDGVTYPVPGHTHISSRFGWRIHPVYGYRKLHAGVDFPAACGTPIVPVMPGTVVKVDQHIEGFGTVIEILHDNGTTTWYAHMYPGTIYVREGDNVVEGQHIADVGAAGTSTGCHLHVELHDATGAVVDAGKAFGWY